MSVFYHVGPGNYAVNDVVSATFGQGFDAYDLTQVTITCDHSDRERVKYDASSLGKALMLSRELIFENIRLRHFPKKPSRFESSYACPTLSDLEAYIGTVRKPYYTTIYEVEPQNQNAPLHYGDFKACYWTPGATYNDMKKIACDYWLGVFRPTEILTTSALIVKRIVRVI